MIMVLKYVTTVMLKKKETKLMYFRMRESEILKYFKIDNGFIYCHNIRGLIVEMVIAKYNVTICRLFKAEFKMSHLSQCQCTCHSTN